jgi:hypothetical protein
MSNLLSQASLVMIPSGYKEDVVYSQIPTSGAGDLSFTRASNGTRINSAGLVEVVPWNLVQYSEEFNNAVWGKSGSPAPIITANTTVAPNGTTTADTLEMTSPSPSTRLEQVFTFGAGDYAISVYVKSLSGINQVVRLFKYDGVSETNSGDITVTNEWTRITYNFASSSGVGTINIRAGVGGGNVNIAIWGFQANIGSTAKPYFPTTDRLNVPRLTYQNGGGGCPSLLLEKQSTNLQTYSEDFTQWTASSATVTANNTTSPDGTQNADRVQFTGAGYLLGTSQGSGNVYTLSCWAKRNGSGTQSVGFFKDGSGVVDSAWALTSDWQRFTYTYTASNGSYSGIAGVNGVDVFVWGAQFEQSSYPTSYIPTTSASATRVADACYKTGISSLIGQTEGTIFIDFNRNYQTSSYDRYFAVDDGDASIYRTGIFIIPEPSVDGRVYIEIRSNNVGVFGFTYNSTSVSKLKIAVAYKNNDMAIYINGTQSATSSASLTFAHTLSKILSNGNGQSINESVLFPTRLTNAELASLTTI